MIDSDMHVLEAVDLWEKYLDPAFRDRAPRGVGERRIEIEGRDLVGVDVAAPPTHFEEDRRKRLYGDHQALARNAEARLLGMERQGIGVALLFPTRALFTHSLDGIGAAFRAWRG